jgi:hypothetical protein
MFPTYRTDHMKADIDLKKKPRSTGMLQTEATHKAKIVSTA